MGVASIHWLLGPCLLWGCQTAQSTASGPAVATALVWTHAFPTEFPSGLWTLGSAHMDSGLTITSIEKTTRESLGFVLYGLML